MPRYTVVAKVDQIVTKEVQLLVNAGSEEEAQTITRKALEVYPKPVEDMNVKRLVTNKATYWIPRSIDVVSVQEEKSVA